MAVTTPTPTPAEAGLSLTAPLPWLLGKVLDPLKFKAQFWPNVKFYKEQQQVCYSVLNNKETYVPAGNKLGKDFVAGYIALWFFLTTRPCRIVTSSAKDDHLRVLWGEIKTFISTCAKNLDHRYGGPLLINHREIKWVNPDGSICDKSYLKGMVASADTLASMQGHHIAEIGDEIPRTLFIGDECSNLPNEYKPMVDSWAHRHLYIGNTWECMNFWKWAIKGNPASNDKGGDIPRPARYDGHPAGYHRKIIHIRAQDSPNVRLGLAEIAAGKPPSGKFKVPGVKGIHEYLENRELWDSIQQSVSLDAEFYEGAEVLMFPKDWLAASAERAEELKRLGIVRKAKALGCDPGQGGANTAWSVVDEYGLIEQISRKTPDTSVIPQETINIGCRHGIPATNWLFDLGGGGKQWMDYLRSKGYPCRGVAFGETLVMQPKRGLVLLEEKVEHREERYVYVNRRAEMYGNIRQLIDPGNPMQRPLELGVFALPKMYHELHRQLGPIPMHYDPEGRIKLLPKDKRSPDSDEKTMTELLGCSPDEADSLVLAVWGMLNKPKQQHAGIY